jgi:hypothetical protein
MTTKQVFFAAPRYAGPLAALLVLCTVALALTFTSFNAPGAGTGAGQGTLAVGINSASSASVVGAYIDSKGAYHGFVRSGSGTITDFNAPGAGTGAGQGTNLAGLSGINTAGTITGPYVDSKGLFHGYIRSTTGKFTILNAPGAGGSKGQGTLAGNINKSGEIAGFYVDAADADHGFLWTSKTGFTTFDAPGSGTGAGEGSVTAFFDGLNDNGELAGNYADSKLVNHAYVRSSDGVFSTFSAPKAGTDNKGCPTGVACKGTLASGIDLAGTFVGLYVDERLVNHGLVRSSSGTITTFDVTGAGTDNKGCAAAAPACKGTFPQNINSSGVVVGYYVDENIVAHGFERSASGVITTFDEPGACKSGTACAGDGTFAFSNNAANAITGYYIDSKSVFHGFVAH